MKITVLMMEDGGHAGKRVAIEDGVPRTIEGYPLRKTWRWGEVDLGDDGNELRRWGKYVRRCDGKGFRVYGRVSEGFRGHKVIERNSQVLLEDQDCNRLFALDIDDWSVEGYGDLWYWSSPGSVRDMIHWALGQRGLGELARWDCVLMWSSSARADMADVGRIRCRLYWVIPEGDSVPSLSGLRDLSRLLLHDGAKVLDGALYRVAQPDYISPRLVTQGHEFLPPELRVVLLPGR